MTRKALLVGVTYSKTEYALPGCINDIMKIAKFLEPTFSKIIIMHDDLGLNDRLYPSRNNVLTTLYHMVRGLQDGDQFYLHFSGHGFYIAEGNAVTAAGATISSNSTQCILLRNSDTKKLDDIHEANSLCDEQIVRIFDHVPDAAKVFVTVDACAAGNVFDLRYILQLISGDKEKAEYSMVERHSRELNKNVAILTAVKKDKYAWDSAAGNGKSFGVFTNYFIDVLIDLRKTNRTATLLDMLYATSKYCTARENKQDPQLSVAWKEMCEEILFLTQ